MGPMEVRQSRARRVLPHPRLGTLVLAAAALTLASTAALAQGDAAASGASHPSEQPDVTVRASRMVRHKVVGRDYAGIPIEQLSLTREISYHDLNLNSTKGAAELLRRVNDTAREACQELTSLYPLNLWTTSNQDCVHRAVRNAMMQLPESVAQLEKEAHGTPE